MYVSNEAAFIASVTPSDVNRSYHKVRQLPNYNPGNRWSYGGGWGTATITWSTTSSSYFTARSHGGF